MLGSGGARGYAHIGVIEALEAAGFTISAIAGSSMGALIGGLHTTRTLDKYKEWVLTLDFLDLLRLVDFTFSEAGIIKGDRVFDQMAYLLGDVAIEELPIPYTAVATDLVKRREVWFQRGSLKQAIRASIAIPMVFTPVRQGKRILVDGGILNPLPLASTVSHHTDLVVAVNLNASQGQSYSIALPQEEKDKQDRFQSNLRRFLGNLRWHFWRKERQSGISMFEIMHRSFETMQQSLSNYKIVGYPPDVVIQIPADACNFYDFHKAYTMIELGRAATTKALEDLEIPDD